MKLKRPYIPWSVRELVVDRQMAQAGIQPTFAAMTAKSVEKRVRFKLEEFCFFPVLELHHRPALVNRKQVWSANGMFIDYDPPANDPEYLVYLLPADHDIETRVRGQHGQHSDLALARKRKRSERKKHKVKRKWPSRKFPSRKRSDRLGRLTKKHASRR